MTMKNPFIGQWRIVWMSGWDQDYVNMEVPGHITFETGGFGSFQFGLVQAQMDCQWVREKDACIDFTWQGSDEGHELTGRGRAEIVGTELHGHLYIHHGDNSAFRAARPVTVPKSKRKAR